MTPAMTAAAALVMLIPVRSVTGSIVAATTYAIAQSGLTAVLQALLVTVVEDRDRVPARARLELMLNASLGLGAAWADSHSPPVSRSVC